MRHSPDTHRRAFTLFELLMVVAIIAVLVSLLMPALGMVRASAQRVACLGHLRQNGLAVLAYLGDNHGWYPTARQDIYNSDIFWFDHLLTYVDASDRTNNGVLDHRDLTAGRNVLKGCPAWKPDPTDVIHGYVGYGFNGCLKMAGDKRRSWWNIQDGIRFYLDYQQLRVTRPEERTLLGDSVGWHLTVGNDKYSTCWAPTRHRGMANYLACDGHAIGRRPEAGQASIADPDSLH